MRGKISKVLADRCELKLELNFVLTSFIISLFYEIVQSYVYNFYGADLFIDNSALKVMLFIAIRLLLALFILLVNFNIIARARKNILWFKKLNLSDIILFILLGLVYTQYNKVINVYFLHTWGYQSFLPLMPIFKIGITPFIQWVVLAPLILLIFRDWFPADSTAEY